MSSVRRRLMAAIAGGSLEPLFTLGDISGAPYFQAISGARVVYFDSSISYDAQAAGSVNIVKLSSPSIYTRDMAFFTATDGHVVRAISDTMSISFSIGINTITLASPLEAQPGDVLGFWASGSASIDQKEVADGTRLIYYNSSVTKPVAGGTLPATGSNSGRLPMIQGYNRLPDA